MPFEPPVLAGLIVVLLLALAWHEAAHAWVADRLGDPTARSLGRVTLNPLKHLDFMLSFVVPVLMFKLTGIAFGGGKPVPINAGNFEPDVRARSFMFVALAGPFSNVILATVFTLVYVGCVWTGLIDGGAVIENPYRAASNVTPVPSLTQDPESLLEIWLWLAVYLNVLLAVFNLVPLPPLDGSRVVGWLLPRGLQPSWYGLDRIGFVLVLAFFFLLDGFEMVRAVLQPTFGAFGQAGDWLIALDPLGRFA